MEVRTVDAADVGPAVKVWESANLKRHKAPTPQRTRRVVEKLRAPDALAYVADCDQEVTGRCSPSRTGPITGYTRPSLDTTPLVLYCHGGRWSMGSVET